MGIFKDFVFGNKQKTALTKAQISAAPQNAQIFCRQIIESMEMCKKTVNVNTFFSRYDLALQRVDELEVLSKYVKLKEPPKATRKYLLDNKDAEIISLIDRISWDMAEKNNKAKRPKDDNELADILRSKFEGFEDRMSPAALEHLARLTRKM